MSPTTGGYGRDDKDAYLVTCDRTRSTQTACAARDGRAGLTGQVCTGCGEHPASLLRELVRVVTEPGPAG